jgi:hypothetical protein
MKQSSCCDSSRKPTARKLLEHEYMRILGYIIASEGQNVGNQGRVIMF